MSRKPKILTINELNGEYRIKRIDGAKVMFSDRWYATFAEAWNELNDIAPCYEGYQLGIG